ncbi:zinc ribbon domain-containing protein [Gammaproteobacteria bacterium]|jgi:putative FmdB family regulatory protein|nr:zinc ribbon domain-containing protein [Gammaproteobacteria bacterium]MDA9315117.1 zinc ribbon domain-containing protein [Gammaproteobacteria bacterium]MDA9343068.1 zinc ribbon domain-containing protein [Gammaproteobacteria bacterium]MDA9356345.1 zinc ribbon domain-containing protein [Gammaproteobacteria bacterium]MDB4135973.1 zinc ribbon domain-containing protein [Gammaproteobacteria bacterium]|tara:strand:- start:664 stop:954 length:291 start_codon:yes stop_codon:yes gene_type:complete
MPIYDYKCSDCGHQIEVIQKFSDEPKTLCIECGKETLKKMVSAPSFRLKGGGWYETDFKTGKKKNIASDDTSSNKKSLTNSSSDSKKQPKQDKITK